jgi:ketosteroid isomerase-like protein
MAGDNIDLIKQGVAALNRRDTGGMLATLHPQVRLEPLKAVLEGTVYEGHEGLRDWLVEIAEDWESQDVEVHEVHELDSGEVLLEARLHIRYRGSGLEVEEMGAWLCEFRDGLVSRIRFYTDRESALATVSAEAT